MRRMRLTGAVPLAPRVRAQQVAAQSAALQLLANFRRALGPFTREPMPVETREHICDRVEVIWGRMTPWRALADATHLLVSEARARSVTALWGVPVLGSPEVRAEDLVVVGAYRGIARGPIEGPGAERAQIWFRPLLRLRVRWEAAREGAIIEGVEVSDLRC